MLVGDERLARVDFDAELFTQLAHQSLSSGVFTRLELAARKFPAARHVLAGRTLRDQHATGGIEQRAGDDVNTVD